MLAAWAGLPTGFIAFILVCYLTSLIVSSGVPLVAGAIAGMSVWYCFKRLDNRRLETLLEPPPEVWPVPLAVAWGILKSTFDGPILTPGSTTGLLPWRLLKQDQAAGVLTASIDFRELDRRSEATDILTATVYLKPSAEGTIVSLCYQVTDKGAATEKVLRLTKSRLEEDLHGLVLASI